MSESNQPNENGSSSLKKKSTQWIPYIGNCKAVDEYLSSKDGFGWLVPKYFNALFRGVSQVVFANNPITGLIILLALFLADSLVGLAATGAATTAIITALLMKQDPSLINAGITTYNAVLVGTVTTSLWTPMYSEALSPKLWVVIMIGSMLSVFVTSALANIFSSFKISLPCLTLPFNVVVIILFICFMPPLVPSNQIDADNSTNMNAIRTIQFSNLTSAKATPSSGLSMSTTTVLPPTLKVVRRDIGTGNQTPNNNPSRSAKNASLIQIAADGNAKKDKASERKERNDKIHLKDEDDHKLNWVSIFFGVICSMGQVYGINNVGSSILMYVGLIIYSPLLCLVSFLGACVSSLTSLAFAPEPYEEVYNGVWGYNGILAAGAVGGFFIVITCHSLWTAIFNVIFTVLLQQTLIILFASLRLPVFTLPFVWSTLLFLSVSSSGEELPRVNEFSFPEIHLYQFVQRRRLQRLEIKQNNEQQVWKEREIVLNEVKVNTKEETENTRL